MFNALLSNTVNCSEDLQIFTSVFNISATDRDVGNAGNVQYSISDSTSTFNISATTGEIILIKKMDREIKDNYTIVIHATDQAPYPFQLSTAYTLLVSVTDVNDNEPNFQFSFKEYFVDETAELGSLLFTPVATDADLGLNSELVYSFVSSNDTNKLFKLSTSNGSFFVNCK